MGILRIKMKNIYSIIVILAALNLAYCEEQVWIDYRLLGYQDLDNIASDPVDPPTPPPGPSVICTAPGPKCGEDCKTLYFCRKSGNDWVYDILDLCEENYCNTDRCSTTQSTECALKDIKFECLSLEGMYPDPGSCRKFHYCVPSIENGKYKMFDSECQATGNFGYNPRTTYCDVPLRNGTCGANTVPLCNAPGQSGSLKDNPTLYYVCRRVSASTVLYPNLYMCPNGKKYNDRLYDCQ